MKIKVAFFGTPEFAANILKGIVKSDILDIVVVVSQPDRPIGRKQTLLPTPVKSEALDNNIEVLQPEKLKNNRDFHQYLQNLELDFMVVVAYGKIMPQSILDIPKYGSVNIHGSILPLYRGASPVQSAIKDGHKKTWLTLMYMSKKMDEWDIISISEVDILPSDTSIDIFQKFVDIWPGFLLSTLQDIVQGNSTRQIQDNNLTTYCWMISKEDGYVSFQNQSSEEIYNTFRAYQPWPWIYTFYNEKKIILEWVSLWEVSSENPGTLIKIDNKNYGIVCHDKKILHLHQVKPEWKKSMNVVDYINGEKDIVSSILD